MRDQSRMFLWNDLHNEYQKFSYTKLATIHKSLMTLGFVQLSNAWQFKNWCCQIEVWCTLRCVTLNNIKSLVSTLNL